MGRCLAQPLQTKSGKVAPLWPCGRRKLGRNIAFLAKRPAMRPLPSKVLAGCSIITLGACTLAPEVEQPPTNQAVPLHQDLAVDPLAAIPVPPSDGPPLFPLAMTVA